MKYIVGKSVTPGPDKRSYALIDKEKGVVSWHHTREEAEVQAYKLMESESKVMMPGWPPYAPPFSKN